MTSKKKTNRRGVSLLEILFCIGILLFGLLGVLSLIPAGTFAVVETTKADRSVAAANAAKAQAQTRDILRPEHWYRWTGSDSHDNDFDYSYDVLRKDPMPGQLYRGATTVIDPLGIVSHLQNCVLSDTFTPAIVAEFPQQNSGVTNSLPLGRFTTVDSITNEFTGNYFRNTATNDNLTLFTELNNRRYRWADDIEFESKDENPDQRPRQQFLRSDGSVGVYPDPSLPTVTPFQPICAGDYSWFFTVTSLNDYNEIDGTNNVPQPVEQMSDFEVSTVICYQRDLGFDTGTGIIPAERLAAVAGFAGVMGAGASDVPLMLPTGVTDDPLEYLDVKPGQWIMLVGEVRDARLNYYYSGSDQPGYRIIGKWYRILSVDDEMDGNIRWITVTGPEWIPGVLPGQMQNTQAIIVDNVIGVFTETMTVER